MRFLIIVTLLLFVGAVHAQEDKPWYESAASACYMAAKERTPEPFWFEHKRILVKVYSPTEAVAGVWFSGDHKDWIATCGVSRQRNGSVVVMVRSLDPHTGTIPADRGIDMTEFEAGHTAKREAAAPPSRWTNEKALVKCTQDLRRDYGDTLSVSGFMGKQPYENNTTLVGLTARDNRAEYKGQQVGVGCIYTDYGSLFTIFFNTKIAGWKQPEMR